MSEDSLAPKSELNSASRAGDDWPEAVRIALQGTPDPEQADKLARGALDALPEAERSSLLDRHPEEMGEVLAALCGVAPFFARYLARHPDWFRKFVEDDLASSRGAKALESSLDRLLAAESDLDPSTILRHFKYYELARLSIRDACPRYVPLARSDITQTEISQLANVLLDRALGIARQEVDRSFEPPHVVDASGESRRLRFCVLGLGKLGASELNFSSDVDLIYLCESTPADSPESSGSDPTIYFAKLAQVFGKIVSTTSVDGFLYRVDLELRPEGAQGMLVSPFDALTSYYENWAATWEKAAFTKARPVAGDTQLGWKAIRAVAPAIFQSTMNFRAVEGIRSLKQKIASARGGDDGAFNVKIDPGGIRDVEFIAQVLLLLHGGRIPQLRGRSTLAALHNLAAVGLLSQEVCASLTDVYLFLRRVENRLQMEGERQVHKLPRSPEGILRLARAMGDTEDGAGERFMKTLEAHRKTLLDLLATSFVDDRREQILDLFARAIPELLAPGMLRELLEDLAGRFAREIEGAADSARALNNLDRFIQANGKRRSYHQLMADRPELVARLASLFAASNYLSGFLASHPQLIEPLFADSEKLLLGPEDLQRDFERVLGETQSEQGESLESQLDALRLFHHRQVVNVGLLDLAGTCGREEIDAALSDIAEVCIDRALHISRDQLCVRADPSDAVKQSSFLVVAMGKLASRELTYGSDLDVIFLYRTPPDSGLPEHEAQEYFIRLAQRFISSLHTPTTQGSCYEVDARLRPSGNQGMLVCSIAAFERYHEARAAVWERQALLRARPVAGDPALAALYNELRNRILAAPLPPNLAQEIHHVRVRMEEELGRETPGRRDFKTGRGGFLDVECAVQYLQLLHGSRHPELLAVDRLDHQLARLEELEILSAESARSLREGWSFLQALGSRLRIVENRSISDFDLERGDLDALAQQLGYADNGREGGMRRALLRDYERYTEEVRQAYLSLLGVDSLAHDH